MSNHPNRKKTRGIPPSSPTPEQIKGFRLVSGLTQTEAAALMYVSSRAWQRWEGAESVMPAAAWELFLIKLSWRGIDMPPALADHIERLQISPRALALPVMPQR